MFWNTLLPLFTTGCFIAVIVMLREARRNLRQIRRKDD